ncbi:MAG: DUF4352 domain-containing protein [Chloroflexota bacterium]|nr:DUF4352 domain-containing protein [Chloroflexota bacterium]
MSRVATLCVVAAVVAAVLALSLPGRFTGAASDPRLAQGDGTELGLGENLPINFSFFEQRVDRVWEAAELSVELGFVAASGRFVVVEVWTTNTDDEAHENHDIGGLDLVDETGEAHSPVSYLSASQTKQIGGILNDYVDPGAKTTVRLVYDVPANATGLRLVNGAMEDPGAWYVDIDRALAETDPSPEAEPADPAGTVGIDEVVTAPAWEVAVVEVATAETIGNLDATRFGGHYVIVTLRVTNRLEVANAFPIAQLRLALPTGERHLPQAFDTVAYAATRGEEYANAHSVTGPMMSGPIGPGETADVIVLFGSSLDRAEYWIEPAPSDDLDMYWSPVPWSIHLGEVVAVP